ncbi:MAG: amino acid adenylation domain-containing protein, partial [Flavitalea sp.]
SVAKNHNRITRFDREGINKIPLSFSQERLWFIDQLEGSVQYNLPTVLRLRGDLNLPALSNALKVIVERHEALRTTFAEKDGQPYQIIRSKDEWSLNIIDGSKFHDQQDLQNKIHELIRKPFDLSSDYMMRGDLITIHEQEYLVVVTMHHIASDAWSLPIIVKEVVELYQAYEENRKPNIPDLAIQYADFAMWQRKNLQGELMERKVAYWKQKLEGVSALQVATDYPRPAMKTTKGAITTFRIEKILAASIKSLGQKQGASLFMTLLAAFKVLLHRYSGQQDICVGTSIAGRQSEDVVGLIGFFANTLALRTEVRSEASFIELLHEVKQTTMEAYDHQEVSFEKVVEIAVKDRDASRSPLFQVMLVLHNTPEVPQLQLGKVQLSNEAFENNVSKFDLTFFINETGNGLQCSVQYRTDLFREDTIAGMMNHYKQLLSSIATSPGQAIGRLAMLTKPEEQRLLDQFNNASVFYPKDKTIVDLFEAQVLKSPGAIALVFEGKQLTYQQLNERSNQLAHYLRSRGIREDSLVPMCVERSDEMIVSILGILKSGAAYVPMEPDFPEDRKTFVLQDTAATVIVSSRESASELPFTSGIEIIEVDVEWSAVKGQPTHNIQSSLSPSHLAYVIYTSGSTGKPKGVMIEHRNILDYVFGLNHKLEIDKCKSYALVSSIATDLGNTVIYPSLVFGGALHVFSKEAVSNLEGLHRYFEDHRIDCLKIVPSHWKALSVPNQLLIPARLLVFGGEALQTEVIESIVAVNSGCSIVNHYGPTETTIGKLLHVVNPDGKYNKTIPIGKPFSNTQVYILSKDMQLCPVGIAGQLYVGGDGVARGYLNNPDLTRQKFISNRFNKVDNQPIYATGDLVRWLPDGNIEFIGRVDDQVKIRGYRVELGEIESMVLHHESVKQAVVLAREDAQGNKRLVGYIVGTEDFNKESLLFYLKEKLPDYMVPGQWVEMEHFPLLPNGKTDKKSLPDPELSEQLSGKYVAPRNEIETKLAQLWQDVLEVELIGIHDDFFELGGHSLLAVRLISAIRKEFMVEMPISDIFDFPTINSLAEQVQKQSGKSVIPPIKVEQRPQRIPLSFSQERLWFIDKLEGSVQYHRPAVLRMKGFLDTTVLEKALQTIVNRHEVLRSVILDEDGEVWQTIKEKDKWQLTFIDGSEYNHDSSRLQQLINGLIIEPFALAADDMMRGALITLNEQEHVLVVTIHHIASDGWSTSVLVKEVVALYEAYLNNRNAHLPTLNIQYADYAIWQRRHLQGDLLVKKINYWKDKLQGVSALQLPTDYARPVIQSKRGAMSVFNIPKELTESLQQLGQQHGTTQFMTLLAALKVLLHRYSGQRDICVGTPIAGRNQEELESLIGFFINTLAIRTDVNNNLSFIDLLRQVRQTTLDAYENQEVPFEKVVDAVVKQRDMSRNPVFQVMFILLNTPEVPELKLGNVQLSAEKIEHSTSLFDLTFTIAENANGLQVAIEYSTDLFAKQTIERMMAHFTELISAITLAPQRKIGSLPMLTETEHKQLFNQFNDTAVAYGGRKTIVDLIEEQAILNPGSVAVQFEKQHLTYKQLNERSNQLAWFLRSKGVK